MQLKSGLYNFLKTDTRIGNEIKDNPFRIIASVAVFLVVAFIFMFPGFRKTDPPTVLLDVNLTIIIALIVTVNLFRGNFASSGLSLMPKKGWKYWLKLLTAASLLLICGIAFFYAAAVLFKINPWLSKFKTLAVSKFFFIGFPNFAVYAPIREEFIFRFFLVLAVIPVLRAKGTIILSGVLFAIVHFIAGNPGPDNFFAGYILCWLFLKSESIAVPVIFHSIANIIIIGLSSLLYFIF